jgi:hypothetical protein
MATTDNYNLKDYALTIPDIDHSTGITLRLPIPIAGRIVGIFMASLEANTGAASGITFALGGASLDFQMLSETANNVEIPSTDTLGDAYICVMDNSSAANVALQAEAADLDAGGSVLTITADGGGTDGRCSMVIVIRPLS